MSFTYYFTKSVGARKCCAPLNVLYRSARNGVYTTHMRKMTKYVQIKTKFQMKSLRACVCVCGCECGCECVAAVKFIYTRVELLKTKLYILFVVLLPSASVLRYANLHACIK